MNADPVLKRPDNLRICNPEGFVYFIAEVGGNDVKIGWSETPNSRLRQLQTASPRMLRLLVSIPGRKSLEQELHTRFGAARIRSNGEWFDTRYEGLGAFIRHYQKFFAPDGKGKMNSCDYPNPLLATQAWPRVCRELIIKHEGAFAILQDARIVETDGHIVCLGFSTEFCREKADRPRVRRRIEDAFCSVVGVSEIIVKCVIAPVNLYSARQRQLQQETE